MVLLPFLKCFPCQRPHVIHPPSARNDYTLKSHLCSLRMESPPLVLYFPGRSQNFIFFFLVRVVALQISWLMCRPFSEQSYGRDVPFFPFSLPLFGGDTSCSAPIFPLPNTFGQRTKIFSPGHTYRGSLPFKMTKAPPPLFPNSAKRLH